MSELSFEAPLAKFEDSEDWSGDAKYCDKIVSSKCLLYYNDLDPFNEECKDVTSCDILNKSKAELSRLDMVEYELRNSKQSALSDSNYKQSNDNNFCKVQNELVGKPVVLSDNYEEQRSGSLEDLVSSFDEKISRCFYNYQESIEKLAPVQVRSQEDVMNECQMWWTITGNFGNILPIDWSKSYACKMHVPSLKLENSNGDQRKWEFKNSPNEVDKSKYGVINTDPICSEEEAIANDLDMHSLILSGFNLDSAEPLKTADEIIREIDDIIQEDTSSKCSEVESPQDGTICDFYVNNKEDGSRSSLYHDKLKSLNICQLNELYLELEVLIKDYSETLIAELALRDELEFQKELKNTFISLLLAVQNRRRQYHVEKKKGHRNGVKTSEPKYLTAVIPYHTDAPLDSHALQVLIKIMKAINEDSPTVPALLTDYILKVLCPT